MPPQLIGFLGILLIFGAIIAIHEFGHFIAAKWSGMGVYEFSLGFGPALFKKEFRGTLYALRIIPLGGYVRIAGMELGEDDVPNGYDKKPYFAKFATLIAGVAMNFVLAIVIIIGIGSFIGYGQPNPEPVVGKVMADTPAATSGVKAGDRIVRVDGAPVTTWEEAVRAIRGGTGETVTLQVTRQGTPVTMTLKPALVQEPVRRGLRLKLVPQRMLGIQNLEGSLVRMGPRESIVYGLYDVKEKTLLVVASLVSMITRDVPVKDLGGPITVMRVSYSASQDAVTSVSAFGNFLAFLAFLSINIGIMNLLPLPALDGGRLLFLLVEGIRRKPLPKEKEAMIHTIGLVVLLGLILLISVKDIFMWVGGK